MAPLYHWPPPNDWAPRQCPGHNPGYSIAWQGCLASPSYPPDQLRDSVLSSYPLTCWYNLCVITIITLINYTAPFKYPPHAGKKPVYINASLDWGFQFEMITVQAVDPMTQATIHPPLCTNNSDWLYTSCSHSALWLGLKILFEDWTSSYYCSSSYTAHKVDGKTTVYKYPAR